MAALDRTTLFRRLMPTCLFLAIAAPAMADPPPPATPVALDTLVPAIAAWVADDLGVPLPPALPVLGFAAPADLQAMRYGEAAGEPGSAVLTVVALYDDDTRTIYLTSDWSGATSAELSILAHEMVHHFQEISGRTYACPAEREAEAFDVQERWLAQFGETLEGSFELNTLARFVLTRCGI